MEIFYSLIIGYLIGSFPTAFIILKKSRNLDITKEGSGNVGAMNSYEVTNSKYIGLMVLLLDVLKGSLSSFIAIKLLGSSFIIASVALNGAVLAHCYNPWLGFKGGKALATALGGSLIISYPVLVLWSIIWFISYRVFKEINFGNIVATAGIILLAFIIPTVFINYSQIKPVHNIEFSILVSIMMIIILSKHKMNIKEFLKSFRKKEI